MKKNVASQVVGAQLNSKTDGSEVTTGTTTVYVTGDAGTQAAGSVGSGACTHEGHGFWTYAPAQAETNYDHVAFTFVNTAGVTATVQIYTSFPQTGDNYARLGAPAGASVSADIAAVKVDTAAVKVKTDFLPSATAGAAGGVFIAGSNAATSITTALTANVIGNVTGNLSGSVGSVTGAVGSVTGAVGSVAGAVGSVTGNVGGNVVGSVASVTARVTANTDQLAGQTVTAAAGVTFPTSVASPTNITAGTITTVTNLTNAPTNGDLTAAMKASVNAEADTALADYDAPTFSELDARTDAIEAKVDIVDTVVDSILVDTAEIGAAGAGLTALGDTRIANLDATVSSRASAANLATVAGYLDTEVAATLAIAQKLDTAMEADGGVYRFTANALEQAPTGGTAPTAADVADAVWDEALAGHAGVGSAGAGLAAAGAAGDPWSAPLPGAYGSGTAGKIVGDNINATISSRATQTSVDDVPTNAELATALGTADDAVLTALGALTIPTTAQIADKLLGRSINGGADGGRMVKDALKPLRNKTSIAGGVMTVCEDDDTTTAWTAAVTTTPGDPLSAIDPA